MSLPTPANYSPKKIEREKSIQSKPEKTQSTKEKKSRWFLVVALVIMLTGVAFLVVTTVYFPPVPTTVSVTQVFTQSVTMTQTDTTSFYKTQTILATCTQLQNGTLRC